jgi:16S rRNA (cytidine1402-2'-O)-methyltransferase
MQQMCGVLYVVATPIGNLADMTERARKVLSDVDLVAAEDTRETLRLLNHLGISAPLLSYHDHNETTAAERLLRVLESGKSVALVSDAGTPLISDPGYPLVSAARERGISVVPVPGASAAICALSAAGLPSDRFLFLGFPPRTSSQRRAWLAAVAGEPGTLILYESAKRVRETLQDVGQALGERRRVVIARELTKRFETFLCGEPMELVYRLDVDGEQRLGEMVLLVEGCRKDQAGRDQAELERIMRVLAAALPLSQAATLAAQLTGEKKNALYKLGLEMGLASDG